MPPKLTLRIPLKFSPVIFTICPALALEGENDVIMGFGLLQLFSGRGINNGHVLPVGLILLLIIKLAASILFWVIGFFICVLTR
ncbi:hypothetical protein D9M68_775480 [compost metagenome]